MKTSLCPLCNSRKPKRKCLIHEEICDACCGMNRDEKCANCDYYKPPAKIIAELPVYKCFNLAEAGMNSLFISREKENGNLVLASFLIDTLGKGIKDCFVKRNLSKIDFGNEIAYRENKCQALAKELSFTEAKRLAKIGARINEEIGLPFPKEWKEGREILGELDDIEVSGSLFKCLVCGGDLSPEADDLIADNPDHSEFGMLMVCDKCKEEDINWEKQKGFIYSK